MKSMAFIILILGYSFLFIGCHQTPKNPVQVIKVSKSANKSVNLSEIVDTSEMIKLETTKSCIISEVWEVVTSGQYIFVRDRNNLYQFERDGKFIRKIGKSGRGPREYGSINSFTTEPEKERIWIATSGKILCFNFEGEYTNEIKVNKTFDYLRVNEGQIWSFFQDYAYSELNKKHQFLYKVYKYSLESEMLEDSLIVKSIDVELTSIHSTSQTKSFSETPNGLYVYCTVFFNDLDIRDTMYSIQNNRILPVFKIDFSGIGAYGGEKRNLEILNMYKTQRFIFSDYKLNGKKQTFWYDSEKDQQYILNNGINDDIYGTGEVTLKPLDLKTNQMYFAKNGYELEGIVKGFNEDSNPAVYFVKLKE